MVHPKTFLLQNIIEYKKNGLSSLGYLHAKHIDDLAKVMEDFAEKAIFEVVEILNAGESVKVGKKILELPATSSPPPTNN